MTDETDDFERYDDEGNFRLELEQPAPVFCEEVTRRTPPAAVTSVLQRGCIESAVENHRQTLTNQQKNEKEQSNMLLQNPKVGDVVFTSVLRKTKTTSATIVYGSDDLQAVYIPKTHFNGASPKQLKITVAVEEL